LSSGSLPEVTIYADGACKGNPGPGAWAAVLITRRNGAPVEKEISGAEPQTTNNRMELRAVIEALKCLRLRSRVTVYSDSAYLVNAFDRRWVHNWLRNGWKTQGKSPVKNRELWEELLHLVEQHDVRFEKVKGHAGDVYNERVDRLANLHLK
jgi:ribonuclease HI